MCSSRGSYWIIVGLYLQQMWDGFYVYFLALTYCNDPKFLDRQVLANSVNPDQTAPRGAV